MKSFRDPITNVLKASGFVATNDPGDLVRDESDTFNLEPGKWQWNGAQWVAIPQATLDAQLVAAQRSEAQGLLASPDGQNKLLRAIAGALLDQLNTIRSIIPRPIQGITRSGTTATATTFVPHGLTTGEVVFVTGAVQAAYNGQKTVTVTGASTFTYPGVAGNPTTPATGSISFVLGTVASLEPITVQQVYDAVTAKITGGLVDNGA